MKAVEAAFNQEKAPVGAFSVITNLRMDLFEALANYAAPRPLPSDPRSPPAQHSNSKDRDVACVPLHCIPPCSHQRRRPSHHWRVPPYLCPQSVLFPFLLCFSVDISNSSTMLCSISIFIHISSQRLPPCWTNYLPKYFISIDLDVYR